MTRFPGYLSVATPFDKARGLTLKPGMAVFLAWRIESPSDDEVPRNDIRLFLQLGPATGEEYNPEGFRAYPLGGMDWKYLPRVMDSVTSRQIMEKAIYGGAMSPDYAYVLQAFRQLRDDMIFQIKLAPGQSDQVYDVVLTFKPAELEGVKLTTEIGRNIADTIFTTNSQTSAAA